MMGIDDLRKRFHDLMANPLYVSHAYALLISNHMLLDRMSISELASYYRTFRQRGIIPEKLDEILENKIKGDPKKTGNTSSKNLVASLQ